MAHCRHRVMDKCKKNGNLCTFEDHCFEPEEEPIMTNADHIRSMSDEELAEWLNYYAHDGYINPPCGWFEWLKQPAEEDET